MPLTLDFSRVTGGKTKSQFEHLFPYATEYLDCLYTRRFLFVLWCVFHLFCQFIYVLF